MLTVTANFSGLDETVGAMKDFSSRRMNATIATALTRSAAKARDAARIELDRSIDRPTDYTRRGLFLKPAKADKLEARVWFGDEFKGLVIPQARYLYPQVEGGGRALKRFEKALQASGAMPAGTYAIPSRFAPLDAFGNVPRGTIMQIVSQLGAELLAGYSNRLNRSDKNKVRRAYGRAGGQYVAITRQRGKLAPGVYLAEGRDFGAKLGFGRSGKLTPIFFYSRKTDYRPRYRFYDVAKAAADAAFPAEFDRAVGENLAKLAQRKASA